MPESLIILIPQPIKYPDAENTTIDHYNDPDKSSIYKYIARIYKYIIARLKQYNKSSYNIVSNQI